MNDPLNRFIQLQVCLLSHLANLWKLIPALIPIPLMIRVILRFGWNDGSIKGATLSVGSDFLVPADGQGFDAVRRDLAVKR